MGNTKNYYYGFATSYFPSVIIFALGLWLSVRSTVLGDDRNELSDNIFYGALIVTVFLSLITPIIIWLKKTEKEFRNGSIWGSVSFYISLIILIFCLMLYVGQN